MEGETASFIASLADKEGITIEDKAQLSALASGSDTIQIPAAGVEEKPIDAASPMPQQTTSKEDPIVGDLRTQIGEMSIPQRLKLALLGNGVARMLLISDVNRLIQEAVLKNPRLGPNEVEVFAKSSNVSEFVLREISKASEWTKSYSIKAALVFNSKTPGDVALKLMRFMNKNDLRRLSKSKNVPQLVSTTARKRLADMEL